MKKVIYNISIALALVMLMFTSCVTPKDTNLLQDIQIDYSEIPPPEEYRVIPGDILKVAVYTVGDDEIRQLFDGYQPSNVWTDFNQTSEWVSDSEKLQDNTYNSTPITIYADGTITFPYVGRIFVQDLTLLEIRQLLTSRLQELTNGKAVTIEADVTLFNNFFSILGESGSRRIYMKNNNMTIFQALTTAGNVSDFSARDKVSIVRQTKDGTEVKTFDLRSESIVNTEFYYIQPNDVIYFPQKSNKFLGNNNSFIGIFGMLTSFVTILVGAFQIF